MSGDRDGDSEMRSSSPSDSSNPQTPTGERSHDALKSAAAGELSPPGSQGPSSQDTPAVFGAENGRGTRNTTTSSLPLATETTAKEQKDSKGSSVVQGEPGASWMTKKAEDEYKRAMEHVVDQDFSLEEFGDPFDQRDMKLNMTG